MNALAAPAELAHVPLVERETAASAAILAIAANTPQALQGDLSSESLATFAAQLEQTVRVYLSGEPYRALSETAIEPLTIAEALFATGNDRAAVEHWDGILDEHLRRHARDAGPSIGQLYSFAGGLGALFHYYPPEAIPTEADVLQIGGAALVIAYRTMFPGADMSKAWQAALARCDAETLVRGLPAAKPGEIPADVIRAIAASGQGTQLLEHLDLIEREVLTAELLTSYLENNANGFMQLYQHSGLKLAWVERCISMFGVDMSHGFLITARDMLLGKTGIAPELRVLGVTETGEVGLDQLRQARANVLANLLDPDLTVERLEQFIGLIVTNSVARNLAQQLVRFDEAQWGGRTDQHWQNLLFRHMATAREHHPMPESYIASPRYELDRIDVAAFDPDKIDQGARERFSVLQAAIREALDFNSDLPTAYGRYRVLFDQVLAKELDQLPGVLHQLERRLEEATDEKTRIGLHKAIGGVHLRAGLLHGYLDHQQGGVDPVYLSNNDLINLSTLKIPALDELLRVVTFARAMRVSQDADWQGAYLRSASLDFDALERMIEFVDHTVGQEGFKSDLTDNARNETSGSRHRAFMRPINADGLDDTRKRSQKGATSGTTTLQIVPSRGLLLELSGKTADACWASLDESLAATHPNLSALTFIRNPGKANERIVGSALLIQTTEVSTGQPILVIRGINPIESYLREVRAEDFVTKLFDYVRSIAGSQRIAVVIDNGPGQASTNRSAIYEVLSRKVLHRQTEGTPLVLAPDSTFNSYRLAPDAHAAYLLRDLGSDSW